MTDLSADAIGRRGSSTWTNRAGSLASRIAEAAKIGTAGSSLALLATYTDPGCSEHRRVTASRQTRSRSSSCKDAKCQDVGLTNAS